jgi:gliding motility-associated-like protein
MRPKAIQRILKSCVLVIGLLFLYSSLNAQKEGNVWCFGDSTGLDFSTSSPLPIISAIDVNEACTNICDKDGNLLLYCGPSYYLLTSGICLWNKNHQVIQNGSNLKGYFSSTQGLLLLPAVNNNNHYILFQIDFFGKLFYSLIDMSCDGGNGSVTKKNKELLPNKNFTEKMQAVRHANGRDWWVLLHSSQTDSFYKFLVNSDTAILFDVQKIGTNYSNNGQTGQMVFSQDGSLLISSLYLLGIELYHFDRCTGLLYDNVFINDPIPIYGISVSKNNQYLYASIWQQDNSNLFQYDLNHNPIILSKKLIYKEPIDTLLPYYASMWQQLMGPDGRIYVSTALGTYPYNLSYINNKYLSYIEFPELEGIQCHFVRNGIYMNNHNMNIGLPNIPNYSLGALEGSLCDTIKEPEITKNYTCYIPNVFSPNGDGQNEVFRIRGENINKASLKIYNRWGNMVFDSKDVAQGWDGTYNGKDCEENVYYFKAEIIFKDGRVENKKGNITLMR